MSKKLINLSTICKKTKVAPKAARARLRRASFRGRGALPRPAAKGRWVWTISDAARIAKYISD
jgi:hypothetical protein